MKNNVKATATRTPTSMTMTIKHRLFDGNRDINTPRHAHFKCGRTTEQLQEAKHRMLLPNEEKHWCFRKRTEKRARIEEKHQQQQQ